jgi:hypothetical protein
MLWCLTNKTRVSNWNDIMYQVTLLGPKRLNWDPKRLNLSWKKLDFTKVIYTLLTFSTLQRLKYIVGRQFHEVITDNMMALLNNFSMRQRILTKVGLLERSFNRLLEFVYDIIMSPQSMTLGRKIPDPSLSNPILATISDGSLNFFHSN